jgi:group I intron endonuclease
MESRYLIYGLVDPITHEVRYIGKSCKGLRRPRQHCQPYYLTKEGATYKSKWIRGLLAKGLKPQIVVIQKFTGSEYLCEAEVYWIRYFRGVGSPLTNLTDGGDGTVGYRHSTETRVRCGASNVGRLLSDETKSKISDALQKENHPLWGKHHTDAAKLKISSTRKKQELEWALNGERCSGRRAQQIADQNGVVYPSIRGAARTLGIPYGSIHHVLHGRVKQVGGYIFRYLR